MWCYGIPFVNCDRLKNYIKFTRSNDNYIKEIIFLKLEELKITSKFSFRTLKNVRVCWYNQKTSAKRPEYLQHSGRFYVFFYRGGECAESEIRFFITHYLDGLQFGRLKLRHPSVLVNIIIQILSKKFLVSD